MKRRTFLASTVAGAGVAARSHSGTARSSRARPVVIASGNGNTVTNGGTETCVAHAFRRIVAGDDLLGALIGGVNIVELDPLDTSVGYGGLPDADGVVTLDASCMDGARRRAGAVACLQGVRTPSSVARAVADQTDHHLLVGDGAQRFARNVGFTIEDDLNTPESRRLWLEWKRRTDPDHYPDPAARAEAGWRAGRAMVREGLIDAEHFHGTINCNGMDAAGKLAGVTTTSGLAWKIPGRVGDSPIPGAGLYVDNAVGAAGSTGRGEANLYNLSSFLVVERMRAGAAPKDAAIAALERIRDNTVDARLLTADRKPAFNVTFYALDKRGNHAAVAFWANAKSQYAVCDEHGPRHEPIEGLFGEFPDDA